MKKNLPRKRAPRSPTTSISPRKTSALLDRIVTILEEARARVVRSVNTEMVLAYWQIGREIVESVQGGEGRAEYGEAVLETLSGALTRRFGRGFSVTNLRYFRLFYVAFSDRDPEIRQLSVDGSRRRGAGGAIHQSTVDESGRALVRRTRPPARRGFSPALSWGHYRTLAKVDDPAARLFYEIEAERAGWSLTDLERQIHTQLFARLRKSRDKAGVMDLALRGIALQRPMDVIRDPYVLDFSTSPTPSGCMRPIWRLRSSTSFSTSSWSSARASPSTPGRSASTTTTSASTWTSSSITASSSASC